MALFKFYKLIFSFSILLTLKAFCCWYKVSYHFKCYLVYVSVSLWLFQDAYWNPWSQNPKSEIVKNLQLFKYQHCTPAQKIPSLNLRWVSQDENVLEISWNSTFLLLALGICMKQRTSFLFKLNILISSVSRHVYTNIPKS